jgi:hypothetical protein
MQQVILHKLCRLLREEEAQTAGRGMQQPAKRIISVYSFVSEDMSLTPFVPLHITDG